MKPNYRKFLSICILTFAVLTMDFILPPKAQAADYYVSTTGNDSNAGTQRRKEGKERVFLWYNSGKRPNTIRDPQYGTPSKGDTLANCCYYKVHSETPDFIRGKSKHKNLTCPRRTGSREVRFTYRKDTIRIIGAGYWRKGRRIYETQNKIR